MIKQRMKLQSATFGSIIISLLLIGLLNALDDHDVRTGHVQSESQVLDWRSHGGKGFHEWGCGGGFVYATSGDPDILDTWAWKNGSLARQSERKIPKNSLNIVRVEEGVIAHFWNDDRIGFDGMLEEGQDTAKKQWPVAKGWYTTLMQPSSNGKYVGVVWGQDPRDMPRADFDHERTKIGIIGPERKKVIWAKTLVGKDGSYNSIVATAIPSDDGNYIAVAGYSNMLAMVDVRERKHLWTRRPTGEVSLQLAVFSPDSSIVYTGGTSAAVYALDVKSGELLDKWWASPTGKEEYGHRISCIAASPDGRWVAAGTGPQGLVFVGSTATSKLTATLNHGGSTVALVQFSPDSEALASFVPGSLKVWKTALWPQATEATTKPSSPPTRSERSAGGDVPPAPTKRSPIN